MNNYGYLVARIALSFVLFWFGGQQLMEPAFWIGYIPQSLAGISPLPLEQVVFINGVVEIMLGGLLLAGVYTKIVALVLALHLALIALFLGLTPEGVRDWGLAGAYLSFFFTGPGTFSVDAMFKTKNPA